MSIQPSATSFRDLNNKSRIKRSIKKSEIDDLV
jgi:hypothetical protein